MSEDPFPNLRVALFVISVLSTAVAGIGLFALNWSCARTNRPYQ